MAAKCHIDHQGWLTDLATYESAPAFSHWSIAVFPEAA